ncbi:MAG: shikimate kinase [Planctomycetota bacterium]
MRDARAMLSWLASEVRGRRKQLGWSRRVLAERTRISERFLADVEAAKANPSISTLCDLAGAFGVDATVLLGAEGLGAKASSLGHRIALLGLRGAGKSSVGHALADALHWPFVELDAEIESTSGLKLAQMFELNGENYFRRVERETLRHFLDDGPGEAVLATGGGIVTESETFAMLRARTWTVWLKAKPEEHWARVVAQGDTRPMRGNDAAYDGMVEILRERERYYRQADATIETTGRKLEEIVGEIVGAWRRSHPAA